MKNIITSLLPLSFLVNAAYAATALPVPSAEALTLGGIHLGDSKDDAIAAAKKLGLAVTTTGNYVNNAIAFIKFDVNGIAPVYGADLMVQLGPLTQRVVAISRRVKLDPPIPQSTIYKSIIDRFGVAPREAWIGRNIEDNNSWSYSWDSNNQFVKNRCIVPSIPEMTSHSECGLSVVVSTSKDDNNSVYRIDETITIFDHKAFYKELMANKKAQDKIDRDKLESAKKIKAPVL